MPVLLYAGLIFFLSSLPNPSTGTDLPAYYLHFFEYLVLSFLLIRAFNSGVIKISRRAVISGVLLSVLYAVSDEIHQRFIPGRDSSLYDVLWDVSGILAAVPSIFLFSYIVIGFTKPK